MKTRNPYVIISLAAFAGLAIIWGLCLIYVPQEKDRVPNFLTAAVSYLIFMAMFVQAHIYNKQGRIMENSLEQTRLQLNLTRELERAYLSVQSQKAIWRPHWPRTGKYFYTFHLTIVNSGRSPSNDVTIEFNSVLQDTILRDDFDYPYINPPKKFIIGPQGVVNWTLGSLLDDDIIEIQNGAKHYFVWVRLRYRDIFENTPIHTFQFCRRIGGVMGTPAHPQNGVEVPFVFNGDYDYAD